MDIIAGAKRILDGVVVFIIGVMVFLAMLIMVSSLAKAMTRVAESLSKLPRVRPIWLRGHMLRGRPVRLRRLGL